jgi:hypothetical protein
MMLEHHPDDFGRFSQYYYHFDQRWAFSGQKWWKMGKIGIG